MGSRGMRFHPSLFLSLRGMKGSKKEREGKDFSLIRGGVWRNILSKGTSLKRDKFFSVFNFFNPWKGGVK